MLALVLDFPLLILQMQDGTSLGMVERGRPVTCAENERAEHANRHRLQAQSVEMEKGERTSRGEEKFTKNLQPMASMALLMNADITTMPNPLPDTIKISTNSRFRLKYCATINVEQSRLIPTPTPTTVP